MSLTLLTMNHPHQRITHDDQPDPHQFDDAPDNRILSKVQKSFWSCTHVNSYSKYTLHINLHILVMILIKA